jgi:hypothetical protein
MKKHLLAIVIATLLLCPFCRAENYTNFEVAVYIPVNVVKNLANSNVLAGQWNWIHSQLKVDKVYIEVQRDRNVASDEVIERVKKFFLDHGVKVAGGMACSDGSYSGQFASFCYTDPEDRDFVKHAAELAARHFDEVIQDDFFFNSTKRDSDIAAKGARSWSQFRLDVMDDAAGNLLVKPARTVNPRVKMVIKFPNWYEHFQGLGYDLDKEPKIFDGIYTGTETRDPVMTDQNLQQYESYEIMRYFDNVAPGRNGGGWVDTYGINYVDRYAEQLWDTMFAKAKQMTLFEWNGIGAPVRAGARTNWAGLHTSFDYDAMIQSCPTNVKPSMARAAGYSLEQVDAFLGRLGNPIGIKSYKPYQSTGEDFLHNYLGNLGIPIDLQPEFPTNADITLLTESAKFDPGIVAKIKHNLAAGKTVIVTSGLFRALQGRGIEDIIEARCTDRKISAHQYFNGYSSSFNPPIEGDPEGDILFPELEFFTNDSWALVRALANGRGYPLLLKNRYGDGTIYVLVIPDNFNDLYHLPADVLSTIKGYIMSTFPVRIESPGKVALFAYDNNTFIIESYLDTEAPVRIYVPQYNVKLRNIVTGDVLTGMLGETLYQRSRRERRDEPFTTFKVNVPPHSYLVFSAEPNNDSGH